MGSRCYLEHPCEDSLRHITIFPKNKSKIEKQKTSRHWILIHLAIAFGLKQNGLYNREDYCFKKTHIMRSNHWFGALRTDFGPESLISVYKY